MIISILLQRLHDYSVIQSKKNYQEARKPLVHKRLRASRFFPWLLQVRGNAKEER